ncbi:Manganese/iron superoxide dismutase [Yarrowia lipolytica]|uniref:Superoxide dismutase n=1 Tax=Yarrowia lipolytica TaxID=4952 RepID=A0A371C030_YARLL|nr:Manganese/iron superoxide dismutase [Yarrowia lipolytica]KAE8172214.1 Manganese/iron superoxide dismutase [Yarrowia lipolytica]QNP96172.1 Superoxide dismutase [Mn] [Yarrowia lipolytica]RDW23280.1 Manganese/iron superoxide dismutase [Yarrowia lipolytica]RDW32478.1 Manganese/iron superoxide dismutase [Yarrowia lipolytica]
MSYVLPPLPYAYDALEPQISAQIMEIHHSKHHQTYVNNLNAATKQLQEAVAANDVVRQIALQKAINFNGGGHVNHSIFWKSLTPSSSDGAKGGAKLKEEIAKQFGSLDEFKAKLKADLLALQGSGWAWLVSYPDGTLKIEVTSNQDAISAPGAVTLLGIDFWEHAYYIQYYNNKAAYFDNLWEVLNWDFAEKQWAQRPLAKY